MIIITTDGSKYLYVVFLLLGDSMVSEFYIPTFRNTLFRLHRLTQTMRMGQSVPKRRHITFRRQGITQKKEHSIQNTA